MALDNYYKKIEKMITQCKEKKHKKLSAEDRRFIDKTEKIWKEKMCLTVGYEIRLKTLFNLISNE